MRRFVPRVMLAAFVAVSATGCAAGAPAGVDPTSDFGGRVLVMVPDLQGPQGARVATELRRLITASETHAAVSLDAIEAAMARYQVTPESFDEVRARQLAPLIPGRARLVSWGSVTQSGGTLNADVKFIDPATGDEIEADATGATTQEVAAGIYAKFQSAAVALGEVGACNDQVARSNWQEALRACDAVLAVLPTNMSALSGRAQALVELERWDEALATYNRLLEADPTNQQALLGAARAAGQLDRTQEALGFYNRYIDLNAATVETRMAVAGTAAQAGDFATAFELLAPQAAANRSNVDYQKLLFGVSAAAGAQDSGNSNRFYSAALDAYSAAYPAGTELDTQALNNAIAIAVALGRNDDAIRLAGAAAQSNPSDAGIVTAYAAALRAAGRHQEAVDALTRLIGANPSAAGAHLGRGLSLLELGQVEQALADFASAAQSGQGEQVSQVLFNAANAAYQAQDWPRAALLGEPAYNYATGPLKASAAQIFVYGSYQQAAALQQANQTARQAGPARQIVTILEKALPAARTLTGDNVQQLISTLEQLLAYNRQIAG